MIKTHTEIRTHEILLFCVVLVLRRVIFKRRPRGGG